MPKEPKKSEQNSKPNPSNEEDGVLDLSDYDTSSSDSETRAESDSSSEIGQLQADYEKLKNSYLYLRADFENYKKTAIKERSDLIKYGNERLILRILDVLDAFDRALEIEVAPENLESYIQGIKMTRDELNKALSQFGLNEIESHQKDFDPAIHEALSSEESEELPPGKITQVFKRAYKLHDRLIRPAQVVVSKEPTKKED